MSTHLWPCRFCTFAERDLPSDYGKDKENGYNRINRHEREKHAVELHRKERP